MANKFVTNRFILDTAQPGVPLMQTYAPALGLPLRILGIRYTRGTTAGHHTIIHDMQGELLWETLVTGPNYVEKDYQEMQWPDFQLVQLPSGIVVIWIDTRPAWLTIG